MKKNIDQKKTPIIETIIQYIQKNPLRFHTPGHKGGKGALAFLKDFWGENVWLSDLTELKDTDNLHHPQGSILVAQELAAEVFGAEKTYFLVGGASAGIRASMLALAHSGEKVLIPRNFHRSVWDSLVLTGAEPFYLNVERDPKWGLILGLDPQKVESALVDNPQIKLGYFVYPTYEGLASPLKEIITTFHAHGLKVVVDEAHGAHFAFHSAFPPSALSLGADVVVQGSHKTIGALTQGAMLHLNDLGLAAEIKEALGMLETSSPSFLILASLDAARRKIFCEGQFLFDRLFAKLSSLRYFLNKVDGVEIVGEEILRYPSVKYFDPTKLILSFNGLSGNTLAEELRRYGLEVELAEQRYVLMLFSFADAELNVDDFLQPFRLLSFLPSQNNCFPILMPTLPEMAFSPRDAYFAPKELVPLAKAKGRICGELMIPYPPGIPLICPGEIFSTDIIEYLEVRGIKSRAEPVKVLKI